MKIQAVWADLAVLFEIQPGGGLDLFPDVHNALDQWRAMGLHVAGLSTDAARFGACMPVLSALSVPVIEQPLPRWRQVAQWQQMAKTMGVQAEQTVFITAAPMLMGFARQAGLPVVGVLRNAQTMAVLDGVWVDDLRAIPWSAAGDLALSE